MRVQMISILLKYILLYEFLTTWMPKKSLTKTFHKKAGQVEPFLSLECALIEKRSFLRQ